MKPYIDDITKHKYTSLGWNKRLLYLMPHGNGKQNHVFLTHWSGVDKTLLGIMRPAFNKSMQSEDVSGLLYVFH